MLGCVTHAGGWRYVSVIWYILRQTLLLYLLPFGTVAQLSTGEPGTAEFD